MNAPRSSRGRSLHATTLLALTLAYVVLGRLGLMMRPVNGFATVVWPPTALSLVALLLGGRRVWPGIAAGAFLTNLWVGAPPLVACGIAVGNTLEAVVGASALQRVPGFRGALDRARDVVAVVVLAAVLSTVVSATVGTASLWLGGLVSSFGFVRAWTAWWTGDFMGDFILAPLLLTWAYGRRPSRRPAVLAEVVAVGVALLAVAALVFVRSPEAVNGSPVLRPFLLFVPLVWAALRFGARGAATGAFVVSVVAVWGTYTGHGFFARASVVESLITVHLFVVSASLPALLLGAVVDEHEGALALERAARAEAQAATRAKDDFLAVLSHELRTPLHAMLGWTELLKTSVHDAARVRKGLGAIERNVRTQTQLIEDLLDVSRIVAGQLRVERARVDLADVIGAAVESARSASSATRRGSSRSSPTCSPTPSSSRPAEAGSACGWSAGPPPPGSWSRTAAAASPPRCSPTSSNASVRARAAPRAGRAGSASAWPSCATSSRCTGGR